MTKKIVFIIVALLSTFAVVAGGTWLTPPSTNDLHVIQLSRTQWVEVRNCVETNGYCRIFDQNAVIVITNGVPAVVPQPVVYPPMTRPNGGGGPYRRKSEPKRKEPGPYYGQTL